MNLRFCIATTKENSQNSLNFEDTGLIFYMQVKVSNSKSVQHLLCGGPSLGWSVTILGIVGDQTIHGSCHLVLFLYVVHFFLTGDHPWDGWLNILGMVGYHPRNGRLSS